MKERGWKEERGRAGNEGRKERERGGGGEEREREQNCLIFALFLIDPV